MSSGLRIKVAPDPEYDPSGTYSDHSYLYTGSVNSFYYAATRPFKVALRKGRSAIGIVIGS